MYQPLSPLMPYQLTLRLFLTSRKKAGHYYALKFTEVWLHWSIINSAIQLDELTTFHGNTNISLSDKSKQALLSHGSHVTVPPIMVSAAFILWGVTEGSTEEAVTCPIVSLLYILLLFYMAPYRKLFTDTWRFIILLSLSTAFPIIIVGALTGSFIEFSAKDSPSPAEKATFGGMLGGIIFLIIVQTVHIVVWTKYSKDRENRGKILDYVVGITGIVFLVIVVSSIAAASVFLAKYYSDSTLKGQLGTFVTLLMFPIIMVLFPVGLGVFRIIRSRRMGGTVRLRDILEIMAYFMHRPILFNMLILVIYFELLSWINNIFKLEYSIPIAVATLGICACIYVKDYLLNYENKRLEGFYYFAQKILLGFFFLLHLILSFLYLSVILENDKGWPVKTCEFVLIYILTVTLLFRFWHRRRVLAKPRKYVYFSGTFGLPLLNSVALAVALQLKADTGKQPLDLRLIVLISGSVILFSWFVIQMSAYCSVKKEKIKEEMGLIQRRQDTELDQRSHDSHKTEASSSIDPKELKAEEGSHDNEETVALSPPDPNGPNTEEVNRGTRAL